MRDGKLVVVKPERNFICDILTGIAGFDASGEPMPIKIIHGDCPTGADKVADAWAKRNMMIVKKFKADWDRYGKSAGPRRNQEMVDFGPNFAIAFPGGAGTKDCVSRCEAANIPVFIPDWKSYQCKRPMKTSSANSIRGAEY
jgi:hypothetical protein